MLAVYVGGGGGSGHIFSAPFVFTTLHHKEVFCLSQGQVKVIR